MCRARSMTWVGKHTDQPAQAYGCRMGSGDGDGDGSNGGDGGEDAHF